MSSRVLVKSPQSLEIPKSQPSSIALRPGLQLLVSAAAHLFPGAQERDSLGASQGKAVRGREEGEGLEETQEKGMKIRE